MGRSQVSGSKRSARKKGTCTTFLAYLQNPSSDLPLLPTEPTSRTYLQNPFSDLPHLPAEPLLLPPAPTCRNLLPPAPTCRTLLPPAPTPRSSLQNPFCDPAPTSLLPSPTTRTFPATCRTPSPTYPSPVYGGSSPAHTALVPYLHSPLTYLHRPLASHQHNPLLVTFSFLPLAPLQPSSLCSATLNAHVQRGSRRATARAEDKAADRLQHMGGPELHSGQAQPAL